MVGGALAPEPMAEDEDKAARRRAFMLELRELTIKHGISIGGCGCCGSPSLDYEADTSDERAGYACCEGDSEELTWLVPSSGWTWVHCAGRIVHPIS